jgi:uncharacterized protein
MKIHLEWDPGKARSNLLKHRVAFEDAARVFLDPNRAEAFDPREDHGEDRWRTIGRAGPALLVVIYTIREVGGAEVIRLISARKANRDEQARYDET